MSAPVLVTVLRASRFAAEKHAAQRRKGESAEPYVNHLIEVAALLAEATDGADEALVVAALLHDAVEDVGVTPQEIAAGFGDAVAEIVGEVTDDKRLPKAERKRLQEETVACKSRRAKLLKLADKTSNLRAIAKSPPREWGVARMAEYVDWAERVVDGCRGLNGWLEAQFDAAAGRARARIAALETEQGD